MRTYIYINDKHKIFHLSQNEDRHLMRYKDIEELLFLDKYSVRDKLESLDQDNYCVVTKDDFYKNLR